MNFLNSRFIHLLIFIYPLEIILVAVPGLMIQFAYIFVHISFFASKLLVMNATDNETGEVKWARQFEPSVAYNIDMETGEPDSNISTLPMRKALFSIPKELIQPPKESKVCCMDAHENYTLFKKEQVIGLQEVFQTKNLIDSRIVANDISHIICHRRSFWGVTKPATVYFCCQVFFYSSVFVRR